MPSGVLLSLFFFWVLTGEVGLFSVSPAKFVLRGEDCDSFPCLMLCGDL